MASGQRLTYDYVKEYFAAQGCELLENSYKNARTKLRYRCICGNVSAIVFDSFRSGNRCRKCGIRKNAEKQTLTNEYAVAYFEKYGCKLLDVYNSSRQLMRYICVCGREARITWNNFQRGRKCKSCGIAKRSGVQHYEWIQDRDKHQEEYLFRQRCYKLVTMSLNATGRVKNARTAKLLGYDYKQLQEHITKHENWRIVKNGRWHIDHIFPIKAFVDYGIYDLSIVNALDNLQPLHYHDNLVKSDFYDKVEFEKWLVFKGC